MGKTRSSRNNPAQKSTKDKIESLPTLLTKPHFYLNSEEQKALNKWEKAHKKNFKHKPLITYVFSTGSGIGTAIYVRCSLEDCPEQYFENDITDYNAW